jgi:hypothetical protein
MNMHMSMNTKQTYTYMFVYAFKFIFMYINMYGTKRSCSGSNLFSCTCRFTVHGHALFHVDVKQLVHVPL